MASDIFTLGAANLKTRTTKGGKQRVRIEVHGDTLLLNTDPATLGKPVADAIAQTLRERVQGVTARAAPATLRARQVAAKALAQGKSWARARYGGGRVGVMPPAQSDAALNDSGRLARFIAVGVTRVGTYVVNVTSNRLDPSSSNFARVLEAIRRHVPELGDPSRLMDSIGVRRAVRDSLADAIQRADEKTIELKKQRMAAAIQLARNLIGLVG